MLRAPESVGRWCRVLMLVLWMSVLLAVVAVIAWTILHTRQITLGHVAMTSLACGWLLVTVNHLPEWRGRR